MAVWLSSTRRSCSNGVLERPAPAFGQVLYSSAVHLRLNWVEYDPGALLHLEGETMKLLKVHVEGYRSVLKPLELVLDPRVTVILGANDHGKTNILSAIQHLNGDRDFAEEDLNWDLADKRDEFPVITYTLTLSLDERRQLLDNWGLTNQAGRESAMDADHTPAAEAEAAVEVDRASKAAEQATVAAEAAVTEAAEIEARGGDESAAAAAQAAVAERKAAAEQAAATLDQARAGLSSLQSRSARDAAPFAPPPIFELPPLPDDWERAPLLEPDLRHIPEDLILTRKGVSRKLIPPVHPSVILTHAIASYIATHLPHVLLIQPYDKLEDSVTADNIQTDAHEFMQGIFYLAGLDPTKANGLFVQNDVSSRKIDRATNELNTKLRDAWLQGEEADLHFKLEQRNNQIHLVIDDPAIQGRVVRPSQRSSGFTHFFGVSMVLEAQRAKFPSQSYIYLFDEPGLYLHPTGQRDMLQVLERLSEHSQVAYSTHSIFMINRNFPVRHRLIAKDNNGTHIDGKPFVGRWKSAIDALGLSLTGTILFAPAVLLVEGDSDCIYVNAVLQLFTQAGLSKIDLNGFSAVSTNNSSDARLLIDLLSSSGPRVRLAALFDGDKGGKARYAKLKKVCQDSSIPVHVLDAGREIEDKLPFPDEYREAVVVYIHKVGVSLGTFGKTTSRDDEISKIRDKFNEVRGTNGGSLGGVPELLAKELLGEDEVSKSGIAREYQERIAQYTEGHDLAHVKEGTREISSLVNWIAEKLSLPGQAAEQRVLGGR